MSGGKARGRKEEKQAPCRKRREGVGDGPSRMSITVSFLVCGLAVEKAKDQTDVTSA